MVDCCRPDNCCWCNYRYITEEEPLIHVCDESELDLCVRLYECTCSDVRRRNY